MMSWRAGFIPPLPWNGSANMFHANVARFAKVIANPLLKLNSQFRKNGVRRHRHPL